MLNRFEWLGKALSQDSNVPVYNAGHVKYARSEFSNALKILDTFLRGERFLM